MLWYRRRQGLYRRHPARNRKFKIFDSVWNLKNANFSKKQITHLGQIINSNGIQPDPAKITEIQNLKTSQNISEVRSLLSLINHYGKFVKNMRHLRKPLNDLLKKKNTFNWTSECQEYLDKFKKIWPRICYLYTTTRTYQFTLQLIHHLTV